MPSLWCHVSIPQAVGAVATWSTLGCSTSTSIKGVSIPQAVGAVATTELNKAFDEIKVFQYRKR